MAILMQFNCIPTSLVVSIYYPLYALALKAFAFKLYIRIRIFRPGEHCYMEHSLYHQINLPHGETKSLADLDGKGRHVGGWFSNFGLYCGN
jgi:hypothetical protein